ncbi:F-box family protein, partial [Trifolium medium]|nr:F-box family protein [Trifolium medium]
ITMNRRFNSIASVTTRYRGKPAKEKVGRSFADLPSSITTCILLQLPIKSVSMCKCVCKTWNALISDPYFATLYSQHASLGFMIRTTCPGHVSNTLHLFECKPKKVGCVDVKFDPKFKLPLRNANTTCDDDPADKFGVVNSCNGLLCLCEPTSMSGELQRVNNLVVCNPITGEFIRLPEATGIMNTRKAICAGLGFQPKTNEYKVIRMCKIDNGNAMVVEMHTLGTTTWKTIEVDPKFLFLRLESPASVNGALHWINFDGKIRSILCFDFESERLQSFPSPPPPPPPESNVLGISMVELKGFLYFCESILNSCVVWLMKKYGIGESWTKVFCTDNFNKFPWRFSICRPIKHFENGGGALLLQWSYATDSFVYFEPGHTRIFDVSWDKPVWFESIPHNPSFISLKNIVKGKNIEVQNVHSWMIPSNGELQGSNKKQRC